MLASWNVPFPRTFFEYGVHKAAIAGAPEVVRRPHTQPCYSAASEFGRKKGHWIRGTHFESPSLGLHFRVFVVKSTFYLLEAKRRQAMKKKEPLTDTYRLAHLEFIALKLVDALCSRVRFWTHIFVDRLR